MCYVAQRARFGVREARQNLSVYLDRVKRGESLEITERGKPVAVLGPIPETLSIGARLVAEGRAWPAEIDPHAHPLPRPYPGRSTGPSISEILQELREDTV